MLAATGRLRSPDLHKLHIPACQQSAAHHGGSPDEFHAVRLPKSAWRVSPHVQVAGPMERPSHRHEIQWRRLGVLSAYERARGRLCGGFAHACGVRRHALPGQERKPCRGLCLSMVRRLVSGGSGFLEAERYLPRRLASGGRSRHAARCQRRCTSAAGCGSGEMVSGEPEALCPHLAVRKRRLVCMGGRIPRHRHFKFCCLREWREARCQGGQPARDVPPRRLCGHA